jgi:hypothetical protein
VTELTPGLAGDKEIQEQGIQICRSIRPYGQHHTIGTLIGTASISNPTIAIERLSLASLVIMLDTNSRVPVSMQDTAMKRLEALLNWSSVGLRWIWNLERRIYGL